MIVVLHKNKILSCMFACIMVIGLLAFSSHKEPVQNVELIKTSSNVVEKNKEDSMVNNYLKSNIN